MGCWLWSWGTSPNVRLKLRGLFSTHFSPVYASGSPIIPTGTAWSPTEDGASQKACFTSLQSSVSQVFRSMVPIHNSCHAQGGGCLPSCRVSPVPFVVNDRFDTTARGSDIVRKDFLGPLLSTVGLRWCGDELADSHESFVSPIIVMACLLRANEDTEELFRTPSNMQLRRTQPMVRIRSTSLVKQILVGSSLRNPFADKLS